MQPLLLGPQRVSVRCTPSSALDQPADLCVIGVSPQALDNPGSGLAAAYAAYRVVGHRGERGQNLVVTRRPEDSFAAAQLMLVGTGDQVDPEWCAAVATKVGHTWPTGEICTDLHANALDPTIAAQAFVEALAQASYRFDRYKSKRMSGPMSVVLAGIECDTLEPAIQDGAVLADCLDWVRDLTNAPARDMTPRHLAAAALALDGRSVSVSSHGRTWLETERFAGLLAVGSGSATAPKLIQATYCAPGAQTRPPLVLVGKGITFDSGGLSIKGAQAMAEMKSDMGGGAVALGVIRALAHLAPADLHVTALVPAAENMPGPKAVHPGDVITHRNGITSEVVNTDCEGRLAMADVVAYAAELGPAAILTIATLTYATIAALGTEITSVMGDSTVVGPLMRSATDRREPLWELPMWSPYKALMRSHVADLRNEEVGEGAGAIVGGLYLKEFAGKAPFAHIDTGGTAFLEDPPAPHQPGATGAMLRTLVQFALNQGETK